MSRRLAPFEDRPRRRRARSNVRERSVRLAVPSILPIIERSSFLASSNDFLQAVLSFLPTTLLPFTSVMATASCLSLSLSLSRNFLSRNWNRWKTRREDWKGMILEYSRSLRSRLLYFDFPFQILILSQGWIVEQCWSKSARNCATGSFRARFHRGEKRTRLRTTGDDASTGV